MGPVVGRLAQGDLIPKQILDHRQQQEPLRGGRDPLVVRHAETSGQGVVLDDAAQAVGLILGGVDQRRGVSIEQFRLE